MFPMKNAIILLVCSFSISALAQDTTYFQEDWKKTLDPSQAAFFEVIEKDSANPDLVEKSVYFISGQIRSKEFFSSFEKKRKQGERITWYESGQVKTEGFYKKGKLHGVFTSYWENGQKKRNDNYKKGKFKEGITWDASGNETDWYPLMEEPVFPGGFKALEKYLKENAKKPDGAAGGRVVVGFVIDKDGSITDVRIEKSTLLSLNFTAFRVVADMPAWKPGRRDGETVRVKYSLPLNFL